MKNKILGGLMLVLVLCFTACEDELVGAGGETTIRVRADIKYSGAESRAVLSDAEEKNVSGKYVFMLYKGSDRSATLEELKEFDNGSGTVDGVKISVDAEYTAIMIANTSIAELNVSVGSTLEALYSATYAVNTTDNNPSSSPDFKFTWSQAMTGLTYEEIAAGLNFTGEKALNPNVAKVTVNITNNVVNNTEFPANQVELVNVQVRNVANKVRFAQNALSRAELFISDDNGIDSDDDVLDYEIEELNLAPSESQTFSWYVPCNMLEPASNSGSRAQKAPKYATYIEIDGIRRLDYMDTAYKVYLGTSTGTGVDYESVGNYYVKADYQYTVNATINDDGLNYTLSNNVSDKNDATEPQKVVYPAGSNCFMVHPKISSTQTGTIYEFPIDQINRFWGLKLWYTGENNEISKNDEWDVVHLWQDVAGDQVIFFCDENGNNITKTRTIDGKTEYYAEGVGLQPVRFKLIDTNTYGNVVVGVRKRNENKAYLWSWHLWITDYNPDAAPTPKQAYTIDRYNNVHINAIYVDNDNGLNSTFQIDSQGFYRISNGGTVASPVYDNFVYHGNVQHFGHVYNVYWSAGTGTYDYWNWSGSGLYANKWIMDRNLGAQTPGNADVRNPWDGFGMYYQYGRKDPFPYVNYGASDAEMRRKMYDYKGVEMTKWQAGSGGTFSNGVRNPMIFYTGSSSSWASDYNIVSSDYWYGLESGKHKSIFDPCPPGWCLPVSNAFWFATYSPQPTGVYTESSQYTTRLATFAIYVHSRGWNNTSNPEYHRNFGTITSLSTYGSSTAGTLERVHLDSVLPIQGYILEDGSGVEGLIETVRSDIKGCYWTADKGNGYYGKMLYFQPTPYNSNMSYNDNGTTITDTYYSRYSDIVYYHRMNKAMTINENVASRGQAVRCIQEPDI